eukprot:gene18653-biopygen5565
MNSCHEEGVRDRASSIPVAKTLLSHPNLLIPRPPPPHPPATVWCGRIGIFSINTELGVIQVRKKVEIVSESDET